MYSLVLVLIVKKNKKIKILSTSSNLSFPKAVLVTGFLGTRGMTKKSFVSWRPSYVHS